MGGLRKSKISIMNINIQKISKDRILINLEEFNRLIEKAEETETIVVNEINEDLNSYFIMKLQEESKSLDFLKSEEENIYSVNDIRETYI
ncbi:MAG: hypothetical protein K1X86_08945 [Ignavibacteria bacterium]|nr:hypothetical protein [Ignavibacteria bacterium]